LWPSQQRHQSALLKKTSKKNWHQKLVWGDKKVSQTSYQAPSSSVQLGMESNIKKRKYLRSSSLNSNELNFDIIQPKNEKQYLDVKLQKFEINVAVLFDRTKDEIFAGSIKNGDSKENSLETYVDKSFKSWRPGLFYQFSQEQFSADNQFWQEQKTKENRFGTFLDYKKILKIQYAKLAFNREYLATQDEQNSLDLTYDQMVLQAQYQYDFLELLNIGMTEEWDYQKNQQNNFWAGNHTLSLSTWSKANWGLKGLSKWYEKIPQQDQLLGDGKLIVGNPDLDKEKGHLMSAGPWLNLNQGRITAHSLFFQEIIKNSPVYVAGGPNSVKSIPLGGVWGQGIESQLSYKHGATKVETRYVYQKYLNNSEILWQKGFDIPDRPREKWIIQWEQSWKKISTEMAWNYVGKTPISLANEIYRPSESFFNVSVGFKDSDMALELKGENLFIDSSIAQDYQNSVGLSLINPEVRTPQYSLQWEIYL
jgi:hypothetical protein